MDYQVFSSEENIFITSGIQQALYLLCNMIFPNSKEKILIEEPTYPQIIELIKLIKLPYLTIQRADNKLDLEKIETLFSEENIKFFYVSSRFQNPLGFNLTKEEKKRVAELASQYDVYIVEDDYMADLDSDDKNDPIFYYDISDKVIYLKSFSKIMFPGLRIGVAVIPTELISEFSKHKKNSDIGSSVFSQAALDIYIKSGMFQNYKHNIKASSLDRIKSFIDSIEKHSIKEKIDYLPPKALKTHIKLPTNVHENEIISSGLNNKVILINSNDFYINIENNPKDILLIELTNLTNSQIKRGANIILDILSKKIK
ncbi:PLP-dependent aminotransferase family protein [Facklamia sp. DSM 111018]|uniref:PLP-dependent aminotransferase family protein n=1 Tax=Facklamia lactis TaxID=2749967 RepID=A0ABS0LRX3_9LACT|nr:PLP-dependent aminotransferase family protein [Facklamia lactis]MBG9986205.1 PLP-dependent aminotransferase family protein [Facklamia lactis]